MNHREQWLNEALTFVPDNFGRDELKEYLAKKLSRCRATTSEGFSRWILLQLARHDGGLHVRPYLKLRKPADFELGASVQNGEIFLIKIGETPDGLPIIWKVPSHAMDFVREHWPVYPKKVGTGYTVYKASDGKDFPLHQLWLGTEGDHVGASDGDFLNWCEVRARVVVEPVYVDGVACLAGNTKSPEPRIESERMVPNLFVVSDSDSPYRSRHRQARFERSIQQPSASPEGSKPKIYPNGVWRAGVFGKVQDCGKFSPWDSADEPNRDGWNEKGRPQIDEKRLVHSVQRAWGIGALKK